MDKTPKKALKQLLCCAVNKDEALVLDSLHGYLYGLAIIPESIHLSEWLPDAFGEEMMGFNSEEEAILRIYWNPEDPPPAASAVKPGRNVRHSGSIRPTSDPGLHRDKSETI